MRRLASSRSSGAFHGWRGSVSAAASVKITREFHCVVGFSLPAPVFSPSRASPDMAKEKGSFAVAFPRTTPTRTGPLPLLFSSRTARPGGKAIIQFFIALHPLRKGYRVPSLPPTSLEGTVSRGKISFPLFFLFFLPSSPRDTDFPTKHTSFLFFAVELLLRNRVRSKIHRYRLNIVDSRVYTDRGDSVSLPDENVYKLLSFSDNSLFSKLFFHPCNNLIFSLNREIFLSILDAIPSDRYRPPLFIPLLTLSLIDQSLQTLARDKVHR